jgi:hypothetical protein
VASPGDAAPDRGSEELTLTAEGSLRAVAKPAAFA